MFNTVDPKQSFPEMEEKILTFWKQNRIFRKSLERNSPDTEMTFYDGPPFATGLPHYGHLLPGTVKDVFPRYFTMKGHRVDRRFGWDCHGLPVENEVEKMLELKNKKDIEDMGVAKFNETCRSIVLKYVDQWEKTVDRMGRWVDFKNDYKTMSPQFMESIWWVFKQLWDKDLIYEGHKSMHVCPRCETPLSNFEVSQGYKDVTDLSVTSKFKLVDEENTYILGWTTTPWTLPGNIALAVGPDIDYVKVQPTKELDSNPYFSPQETYIVAKSLFEKIFTLKNEDEVSATIVKEFKGSELIGKRYHPLFNYYKDNTEIAHMENAYVVVEGDFVSTEDGTGVVHIAPAFGEDDLQTGLKNNLPFVQHVNMDGTFKDDVTDFKGEKVKKMDRAIAKNLHERGLLFNDISYTHSYPHCWRCDTALLNYCTNSWFVKVEQMKEDILKSNEAINWVPEHIKHGRFGKWLEKSKDWAISRARYWGTPLPVWRCECGNDVCLGSMDDIKKHIPDKVTKVIFFRHGESEGNKTKMRQCLPPGTALTEDGRKQVEEGADMIHEQEIPVDVIISSSLLRTKQTVEILASKLGVQDVLEDERITEIQFGVNEGKKESEILESLQTRRNLSPDEHYSQKNVENGESHEDVTKRMNDFLEEILKKYKGKTVLVVSHSDPLRCLIRSIDNDSIAKFYSQNHLPYARPKAFHFDVATNKSLDLHKHFMDEIQLPCPKCSQSMKRIPEVLDCWFESGSMPYAFNHYPFENKTWFEKNFPASFIAEGLDQTRGWFYTLVVLSTALFKKPAFKNVVVNGIVLAEDGKKMSKRLKNYPEPGLVFDKYGADAMRFYLMNSVAVKADDICFGESPVEEVVKNIILPIWNSYSFFVTYANIDNWEPKESKNEPTHKLDKWILSRMNTLIKQITQYMDAYDLQKAMSTIPLFIDDLTNWYIRRSRRRFWKSENDDDKDEAYNTLYTVLLSCVKVIAPVMPFLAEEIYQNLKRDNDPESIHLCDWPKFEENQIDDDLEEEFYVTKTIVALGHAARAKAQVKVRQPLGKLQIGLPEKYDAILLQDQISVIEEELNVKQVEIIDDASTIAETYALPNARLLGPKYGKEVQNIIMEAKKGNFEKLPNGNYKVLEYEILSEEIEIGYKGKEGFGVESAEGLVVALDVTLTEDLKLEGQARDIVRVIQDMRKEADYHVSDRIQLSITGVPGVLEQYAEYIRKETLADAIIDELASHDVEKTLDVGENKAIIRVFRK